jgi:hypothetical protein
MKTSADLSRTPFALFLSVRCCPVLASAVGIQTGSFIPREHSHAAEPRLKLVRTGSHPFAPDKATKCGGRPKSWQEIRVYPRYYPSTVLRLARILCANAASALTIRQSPVTIHSGCGSAVPCSLWLIFSVLSASQKISMSSSFEIS